LVGATGIEPVAPSV